MATKSKISLRELWKIEDPREMPIYSIPEAAHYLRIPTTTLRAWVLGQKAKDRKFERVIYLPRREEPLLSFFNLAEAHVLRALRTQHSILLPKIRRALQFVKKEFKWERPLIQQDFMTDGVSLFVEKLGVTVDASASGQVVMRDILTHMRRIEWEHGLAARLYPFTRSEIDDAPQSVMIDPRHSFGRPILKESRIPTAIIAERYKAGDSVEALAADYECSRAEIEEGIRCELRLGSAA
jgi:uncharacterized protein (DUF433 family)